MMRRYAIVVAFSLLATLSAVVYAAVSYPAVGRGPFGGGLAILLLVQAFSILLGWRLQRRVHALCAELERRLRQVTATVDAACAAAPAAAAPLPPPP